MYQTEPKHSAGLVLLLENIPCYKMRVSVIQVNSEKRWEIRVDLLVPFFSCYRTCPWKHSSGHMSDTDISHPAASNLKHSVTVV